MSADATKQAIDAYCAGISAMNPDTILSAFAEDAVDVDPVGSPPMNGHAGIRQFFESIFGLIASLTFTADGIFGTGDDRALKWTMRGKGKNGHDFSAEGVDVMQFDDGGKIKALAAYWDAAPILAAIQA